MSISLSFKDTHAIVGKLKAKGVSQSAAEGLVEILQEAQLTSEPATAQDVQRVEQQVSMLRGELYRALSLQTGATVAILSGLYAIFG